MPCIRLSSCTAAISRSLRCLSSFTALTIFGLAAAIGVVLCLDRENAVVEGHLDVLLPDAGELSLELVVIAQVAEVCPEGVAGLSLVILESAVDVVSEFGNRARKAPYDIENSRSAAEIIIIEP